VSLHGLPPGLDRAMTVMMWRKGALSPKVRTLRDVLVQHAGTSQAETNKTKGRRRRNGK
jgi:hypothetical protein